MRGESRICTNLRVQTILRFVLSFFLKLTVTTASFRIFLNSSFVGIHIYYIPLREYQALKSLKLILFSKDFKI